MAATRIYTLNRHPYQQIRPVHAERFELLPEVA
jgi:hypothetical protein